MIALILLLLDVLFGVRKLYHELARLLPLARGHWKNRQFLRLAVTIALAVLAIGPLYVLTEIPRHI
jgi:hypothetical protein